MLPREVLQKIRRIEIRTGRLVDESFAGEYHSVFKGRGMEFSEVREYQPGDDVRIIDWNVTSRLGHPFVKVFVEERELTVLLLVDHSGSFDFGSRGRMKAELAAEVGGALAFCAIRNQDRVGALFFTDRVEKFVPPRKGRTHVLRTIREILYFRPRGRGTDLATALDYLLAVTRKRSVVFILSDFLLPAGAEEKNRWQKSLRIASKKHDVIAVPFSDPLEEALPPKGVAGLFELEDPESGARRLVHLRRPLREQYAEAARRSREEREKLFLSIGVDSIPVRTNEPWELPLVRFFEKRARRLRT